MKIMGTIYLTMHKPELSEEFLKKSQRIFASHKQPKRLNDTKSKLQYVKEIRDHRRHAPALRITKV